MDGPTSNGTTIWNNLSAGTTASNAITFTTGTTDTGFSWYPILEDKDWLPYCYKSYEPKWHILLGYKTQLQRMWD
jgi:hypothetical protein